MCVDGICHSPADLPLSNGQCRAGTVNINGVCVEQNTAAPGSSCASGQVGIFFLSSALASRAECFVEDVLWWFELHEQHLRLPSRSGEY